MHVTAEYINECVKNFAATVRTELQLLSPLRGWR